MCMCVCVYDWVKLNCVECVCITDLKTITLMAIAHAHRCTPENQIQQLMNAASDKPSMLPHSICRMDMMYTAEY